MKRHGIQVLLCMCTVVVLISERSSCASGGCPAKRSALLLGASDEVEAAAISAADGAFSSPACHLSLIRGVATVARVAANNLCIIAGLRLSTSVIVSYIAMPLCVGFWNKRFCTGGTGAETEGGRAGGHCSCAAPWRHCWNHSHCTDTQHKYHQLTVGILCVVGTLYTVDLWCTFLDKNFQHKVLWYSSL